MEGTTVTYWRVRFPRKEPKGWNLISVPHLEISLSLFASSKSWKKSFHAVCVRPVTFPLQRHLPRWMLSRGWKKPINRYPPFSLLSLLNLIRGVSSNIYEERANFPLPPVSQRIMRCTTRLRETTEEGALLLEMRRNNES